MNLGNGWDLTEATVRQIKLLESLDQPDTEGTFISLREAAAHYDDKGFGQLHNDLDVFKWSGWVNTAEDYDGISGVMLLEPGQSQNEQIRELRGNRARRNAAARDAFLHWLYDAELDGQVNPVIDDFPGSRFGFWFGEPFPEPDFCRASFWLAEEGYIRGASAGSCIPRPSITSKGQRVIDAERSVNDPDPQRTGDTFTVNQTAQTMSSQIAGRDSVQTMTVTLSPDQRDDVLRLIAGLRELASTVPDANPAADEVEQAAAGGDLTRLQRAVIAAQGAAFAAIGTDVGNQVVQLAHSVLQATH